MLIGQVWRSRKILEYYQSLVLEVKSYFLLGVFDGNRIGALRFKIDLMGDFQDNNSKFAAPPWTSIRILEDACLHLETSGSESDPLYGKWLNSLIAPGSSLGGARPKAGVTDSNGHLWIAKFPSRSDERNIGAWEMIVHELAKLTGLIVPECKDEQFSSDHHTLLTKRFDRNSKMERIHFASAMTMLGYTDSADALSGVSYLEIAEFLIQNGAETTMDLRELWKRIIFSICVSNTDDHLRNHDFLLTPEGWRLSPAYDINPVPFAYGLSLNISENDNRLDMDLALSVAPYFRIDINEGKLIIEEFQSIIGKWPELADRYSISKYEQDSMRTAFTRV